MDYLVVPMAVRARLGENGSEGLVMWIGQFAALAGVMAFLLRPH